MTKRPARKSDLPKYRNPPVNEVVYGVRFAPLKGWKVPHIGVYWQLVAANFPKCEHASPVAGGDMLDPTTGLPLPRVWLINQADDRLIQLQGGRYLFNWRRREGGEEYPSFDVLFPTFRDLFNGFMDFARSHGLGDFEILEFELTYINHILPTKGWDIPRDTERIIAEFVWQKGLRGYLPRPENLSWQAAFQFEDLPGRVTAKLRPAKHIKDDTDLIVLEFGVRGLPKEAPLDAMEYWFGKAHEAIVLGFEDMTTEEAQRELWGKYV